ncbi:MAG: aminopeptidase N, partial [Wenzhouxiangella sp.]
MPKSPDDRRRVVERADYRAPVWLVDHVDLKFELERADTRVTARLAMRKNASAGSDECTIVLNGCGLDTRRVALGGRELSPDEYRIDGEILYLEVDGDETVVETEVVIHPAENTALEGLYAAGEMLLTQCEAEGFRKITWYPDRPDVMAAYRVRIEGDRQSFPVMLSNGNRIDSGSLEGGRHFVTWEDPYPKPSYLFALVAGDLAVLEDEFVTRSGRRVALKIHSEPENLDRLDWAMTSLKNAMAWDEERFGLEYDLDIYHVVATHDFNMGAMENKSLNIFNSRYVLADPDTATDTDFEGIESVIGHEYFHNWTGNRVTCRDWFQLTLKEGLTVFRDQEFSADLRSRGVRRIGDVSGLMARQFPEDDGPMAHPVRPERYQEINNFYTATVYEKGAEVVRMYQTLLGRDGFRKGLDLYFERHDGQAVTCDDFLAAMADANAVDLDQFARWYRQTGTPRIRVESEFDHDAGEMVLRLTQSLPSHPDNRGLGPVMIPVRLGFLDGNGRSLPVTLAGESEPGPETRLLVLTKEKSEFRFTGIDENAVLSLLRDFSAPVRLDHERSADELAVLAGHDPDPVSRWRAMRRLAENAAGEIVDGDSKSGLGRLTEAWRAVLIDHELDPALAAELLAVPDES